MSTIVNSIDSSIRTFNLKSSAVGKTVTVGVVISGLYALGNVGITLYNLKFTPVVNPFNFEGNIAYIVKAAMIAGGVNAVYKIFKSNETKAPVKEEKPPPSGTQNTEEEKKELPWAGKTVIALCTVIGAVGLILVGYSYPAFTSLLSVLGITATYFAAYGLIATALVNIGFNKLSLSDVQVWFPGVVGIGIVTLARLATFSAIGH